MRFSFIRKNRKNISKKNYLLLIIIAVCAIMLSILSYQYSLSTANQILDLSSEDIKSNAKIQAHDLALIITNGLSSLTTNLQILSTSPGIIHQDMDATSLLDAVQKSTNELPDYYLWLDQNGRVQWISGGINNSTNFNNLIATANIGSNNNTHKDKQQLDLSSYEYFKMPRITLKPYYSRGIVQNNIHHLGSNNTIVISYVSYPILNVRGMYNNLTTVIPEMENATAIFKGVVVGVIRLDLASNLVKRVQSSAGLEKNLVLLTDNNGTILSSNRDQILGKNIFHYSGYDENISNLVGNKTQSTDDFIQQAIYDTLSTSLDISSENRIIEASIISEPIISHGVHVWTLFAIAPHNLTHNVSSLFEQQNNFSTLMTITVGIVALSIALLIMLWNRQLESIVESRTLELKRSNNYLLAANEQLKTHDKLQNEFINVASHEMKTPTQSILLHSSLLLQSYNTNCTKKETIDAILRNAIRLQKLTNDILDVTRIASQTLKLDKERFNLSMVILQVLEEFDSQIDSGKVNLTFNPTPEKETGDKKGEPTDIFVVADRSRITQVISNLINNAIKFTNEGFVEISTKRESVSRINHDSSTDISNSSLTQKDEQKPSSYVAVSVKDSGQGIDPLMLSRLFTKFATKSDSGVGLGLYISKNIIEAHGGRIWAENNKGGKGATFSFSLPLS